MRINKKDFTKWIKERHSNWRAVRCSDTSCPIGLYLKETNKKKYEEFQVYSFDNHCPWVQKFIHEVDANISIGTYIGSKISRKRCLEILNGI